MNQDNPIDNSEESQADADSSDLEATNTDAEFAEHADATTDAAAFESLQSELLEAKDQALRAVAELQNAQRRARMDVEKAHKFALEKFVNDLLPVADNLERAITASEQDNAELAAVVEGVELTLKTLVDALKKHGVEPVDPAGEPFDPESSQAMTMVPNPDVEPNTVIDVFQKGYRLSGRLVRPAMVVVAKSP